MLTNKPTNKFLPVTLLALVMTTASILAVFASRYDRSALGSVANSCSKEKFVMPSTIAAGSKAFSQYLSVASLPMKERKEAFRKLSKEDKATFIKVNLALQLVKKANLTKGQQGFITDSISQVSPDVFDINDPENARRSDQIGVEMVDKAFALFPQKEAGDFVEPLNTNKAEEIALLQKYEGLLKVGMAQRRQILNELPIGERVSVWQTQMAFHLATAAFSIEQKEFIADMMPRIIGHFEAAATLSKNEQTGYLANLEAGILERFTKTEAFAVFMEVGIQKFVVSQPQSEGAQLTCDCRWYCSGQNEVCRQGGCFVVPQCGPFDTWDCTGNCVIPIGD